MKVRVKFSKQGNMKFIGHLDVMRYFQKAIRRAGIDIAYTEGLSPHMIMSFASPLGVGLTSDAEYLDIELRTPVFPQKAIDALNRVGVDGIEVTGFYQIPDGKANKAMTLVAAADYVVQFREGHDPETLLRKSGESAFPNAGSMPVWPGLAAAVSDFYARRQIPVWKETKKSAKEVDIRPMIYEMYCVPARTAQDASGTSVQDGAGSHAAGDSAQNDAAPNTDRSASAVFMELASGSAANLKPELVMEALLAEYGIRLDPFALEINRCELYADTGDGVTRCLVPLSRLGTEG